MPARQDRRLVRTGDHWLHLPNPCGVPAEICARDDVPLEHAAVDEALALLETARTLERLAEATPGYDGPEPRIARVALTPDFHKGAGIPIGTVLETEHALLPQAVGNDVNCGMRLEVTSLRADRVRPRLDALERRLRHLSFEGGRRIALTPVQREALLRDGLPGLLLADGAPWQGVHSEDADDALDRMHAPGFPAATAEAFADWVGSAGGASHDSVIGGIGGGDHFAAGNRFFLSLTMRAGLAAECGGVDARLLYDAPHNLFWQDGDRVVHRKGATPAGGHEAMAGGPYAMWGEPVIVPGSMGAASFVLRGHGDPRTLASACHGAGRRVPRGASARGSDAELDAFLREFRVVTPLDHRDPVVARRSDVMAAWRRDLKQEAPWAYKDIGPVVSSLHGGGVAAPVAELRPLLTVKG
ncbi:RtcB family protein [Actinomadura physcomitrii]|nr:RtcB family protein [Actinomadura physcomitrii]